jgi:hypothetical protein
LIVIIVDPTAPVYSFQARRPPTRMPLALPLLQQLQCRASGFVQSVSGANDEDNVGRFGFMSLQAIRIGVAPVGEIHHLSRLDTRPTSLGRLYDVESVAVEEERVLSKQFVQLRNHWVRVGNDLAFELGQSLFDLCGR